MRNQRSLNKMNWQMANEKAMNYLKTGSQIQKEHHRNHLHQSESPLNHVFLGDSIVKHVNRWDIY